MKVILSEQSLPLDKQQQTEKTEPAYYEVNYKSFITNEKNHGFDSL